MLRIPLTRPAAALLRQSSLVRGGLVVGAGILIGNITGFVRVMVTAYLLGTHANADALAVALGPVDFLNLALINTMLVAFVPLLMARPEQDRAALFAKASRVFPLILAGIALVISGLAPWLVYVLGPGLAPAQHHQAVALLRVMAPAVFFGGSSAVFAALLYTERRFVIPALYQACVNGGMIAGALLLWRYLGAVGFAIGYTAGAALQLALTSAATRDLRRPAPRSSVPLRVLLGKPAMFLLYACLLAANILLTRAYATHAGPGVAAAFDYCLRGINVAVAYLVYPVANSLLPEIARLRSRGEGSQALRLIDRSVGIMSAASVLICVVAILFRRPAIELLFERGSFTAHSTEMVSSVFLALAPAIAGWALLDLISRCSFALDRPKLPVFCAAIPVTVNFLVLSLLHVQAENLAAGAAAGLITGFAVLFGLTHLRRGDIGEDSVRDTDVVVRVN